ncbi:hypothetical protein [Mycobacterium asiaticum]|uniref:NlpC/P60 domain-containing protein n=1 Tax=Mycobacterium asiaticum TaxID=1790 RepID=A0A1A3MU39_MYCAS|nr:hypothetical protein [Mycobacterium asiaticum]OBK12595.1 hypothetical protein A5636_11305 [Mycobacterium asiaticum]
MTDGDLNLATLWVPVAPETSKIGPAMEEAGRQAKGKFSEAAKGIGNTIHEDLAKAGTKAKDTFSGVGKSITDVFSRSGSDAAVGFTKEFESGTKRIKDIGAELGRGFDQALDVSSKVSAAFPAWERLSNAVGFVANASDLAKGAIGGIGDAIRTSRAEGFAVTLSNIGDSIKDSGIDAFANTLGDLNGTLQTAEPLASRFGIDIAGWKVPDDVNSKLGDFSSTFHDTKDGIKETTDALKELSNGAPAFAAALAVIADAAAPLALLATGGYAIYRGIQDIRATPTRTTSPLPAKPFDQAPAAQMPIPGVPPAAARPPDAPPGVTYTATPGSLDPFAAIAGVAPMPAPGAPAPLAPIDVAPGFPAPTPPAAAAPPPAPAPAPAPTPAPLPRISTGGGGGGGGAGSVTDRPSLYAAGSRVANLYAFAQSLVGTPYSTALRNDCSGMVSELASVALGLPPPAAGQRFSTDNEGDWLMSHGFLPGMGPEGSLRIGWHNGGPGGGHTAATLPNGVNAEQGGANNSFTIGAGAAGANSPQFEHHAYLPMGKSGSSGPVGTEHDPLYVMPASGAGGVGGSPLESQGQQLGAGLLGGIAQSVGLDGSVFKGFGGTSKSPLDFGIARLGSGLLNFGMGLARAPHLPLADMESGGYTRMPGPNPGHRGTGVGATPGNLGGLPLSVPVSPSGGGGGMEMGGADMAPGPAGAINSAISGGINLMGALFSDLNPAPALAAFSQGEAIAANATPVSQGAAGLAPGVTNVFNGDFQPYNVGGVHSVQEQKEQYLSSGRSRGMIAHNGGGLPG